MTESTTKHVEKGQPSFVATSSGYSPKKLVWNVRVERRVKHESRGRTPKG